MRSIIWFRNDLRLHDNEAITRAVDSGGPALPVYCFDPRHFRMLDLGFRKTGIKRTQFLMEAIADLKTRLQEKGSDLYIAVGEPEKVLAELVKKYKIETVFAQKEIASEETSVEESVKKSIAKKGADLELIWGKTLYHLEDTSLDPADTPATAKAFRKALTAGTKVRPLLPIPEIIPTIRLRDWGAMPTYAMLDFAESDLEKLGRNAYQGGETPALDRLQYYTRETQLLTNYKFTRNRSLGSDYSSKFSPWMALGCLSPRKIYWEVKEYEQDIKKNISTWWLIFEVLWRDYFKFQGLKYGDKMFYTTGVKNRKREWSEDKALFDRWQYGQTGIPFVDAHMREMVQTGFMSNRGRVNCASFLTRDYKINWTWGAAWFETHLLDYDVCSNWLNWNTQATEIWYTNPVWQGLKYDKTGEYVKTWLPELADVDAPIVQAPWLVGEAGLSQDLIKDYPEPVEIYSKWTWAQNKIRKAAGLEVKKKEKPAKEKA